LPDSIFKNCSSLQSFTIPGSVTQIGGSVFYGCSSLTSIDIPDSVTSMGGNAFWNCSSLTSITIPDGITRLSDYIFYNCSSLSSITIPDSVNDFGFYAFANCTSLSSLIIPDDFTAIRDGVFSGCTSLSSITIPAGVTSIGNDAFLNCSNLTIYGYAGSYAESYAASNSIPFVAIDGASAPLLIADNSDNTVGQAIDITFTDDADWRAAITGISVGGSALSESQYTVTEGNINIVADVFTTAGDYAIAVQATGYSDATVTQTIVEIVGPSTWYVDGSGGADFTSIQAAVTAASDGDTIMVKDGTYTENVVVDKSLVIQSENGADLTIVQAAVTTSDVFEAKAGNVTIDGFTVSGASSTDKSGIAISGTSSGHCTIINNQCTGNSLGIAIKGLSSNNQNVNNTVTGNSCSASGQYGIYLSNTSSNSVTSNTFSNNPGSGYTGYGICLFDNADNNTFNNNIADSNNMGLRVKNADNNTIINNTFSNNNIGIELATKPIGNVFYQNNLKKNTTQLSEGYNGNTENSWNSPSEITYTYQGSQYSSQLGNYWSDYSGADSDGDGIGDSPYATISTYSDNYPLMGQWQDGVITIQAASPPHLTADNSDNTAGQAIDITFTDDADWRAAITSISVGGSALSESQYTVTEGNINIVADVFTAAGDYAVVVTATGYSEATVTQTINALSPIAITIDGNVVGTPITYTLAELRAMPVTNVENAGKTYTGVAVDYLLSTLGTVADDWEVSIKIKDAANPLNLANYSDPILAYERDGEAFADSYGSETTYLRIANESSNIKYVYGMTVDKPVLLTPPVLTADNSDNTVGQAIDITFVDDVAWRAAITGISVGGSALSESQYAVTEGNINIAADVFTAAGDYAVVVTATGYSDATVTQTINAPSPIAITIDGNVVGTPITYTLSELRAMPVTNVENAGKTYTGVAVDYLLSTLGTVADDWEVSIKIKDTANPLNLANYSDPILAYERDGVAFTDSYGSEPTYLRIANESSNIKYVYWMTVNEPEILDPPALTADSSDNTVGQAIDITFATDATWEAAITGVTVDGTDLVANQYTVTAGNINIAADVFTAAGNYEIAVQATGYSDATVTQTIIDSQGMIVGNIYTIAGNGTAGFSGDGAAAINASLNNPWDVVLDGVGGFYIADSRNHCVRKVDVNGIITTIAGTGTVAGYTGDGSLATSAQLNSPSSVAIDGNGNLLIADTGNNCIRKVDADGIITTIAGTGSAGYEGDGGIATGALLNAPRSIAVDSANNIYIADYGNRCIRKIDPSGDIITTIFITSSSQLDLLSVAVDQANNIYYGIFNQNLYNGEVWTISPNGVNKKIATAKRANGLNNDSTGNLYFVDNGKINKLDPSGVITQIAGGGSQSVLGDGGPATSAFIDACGMAVDNAGNLYFADGSFSWTAPSYNQRVRFVKFGDDPIPEAPELTADTTDNAIGLPVNLSFENNADWMAAINVIKVNGQILDSSKYTVTAGNINISADVFTVPGDYTVAVYATAYQVSVVTQTMPEPSTWYVNGSGEADFTTIQAAVTAASYGDTIIVKDGIYTENVVVDKSLVIKSENGALLTIVQAAETNKDVFEIKAGKVTIEGFTVSGASSTDKSGIAISGLSSGYCTIINNQCSGNDQGIAIKGLSSNNQNINNKVDNNSCSENGRYGIYLSNTSGNLVTNNTFSNNPGSSAYSGYGICVFDNADNNTFSKNMADFNNMGIRVKNADSNKIILNTFSNNNIGLEMATGSIGNIFYRNNFVDNTTQLSAGYGAVAGNAWNSPTELSYTFKGSQYSSQLGNYWSNYTGVDADGNGIGDTAFVTIAGDSDNYPLMGTWQAGVITVQVTAPPDLTADSSDNTVGQAIDITFTDDADWRAAITGITVGGSDLSESQYAVSAGNINIAAEVFTTAGDYAVVVTATGYSDATVTQTMVEATVAPTAAFGADTTSGTAPLTVTFTDESTGTAPLTYAWDFNNDGTVDSTEQNPSYEYSAAGTYSVKLTVTNSAGSDDEIKTDYISVSTTPSEILDPPDLTVDNSDNTVGQAIDITFVDDVAWRAAITGISVGGSALSESQYTVTEGNINIVADVFTAAGDYAIAVQATGYSDATVAQTVLAIEEPSAVYSLSPAEDDNYTPGTTVDGINTMTVKAGVSGFKYFTVEITPVTPHAGNETVVFTHLRNGIPQGLNATRADFDQVSTAHAGFNVQAGDVIKVYIVDELTNDEEVNPIILQ